MKQEFFQVYQLNNTT